MIELLILAILLDGEYTIYKIKQKIKSSFSVFLGASFGSIHPALKKLEKNGHISALRKMSEGGQKSSIYAITERGKIHFDELMTAEIIEPLTISGQLVNIKIMLIDLLDKNSQKVAVNSIKRYYEISLLNIKDLADILNNPHQIKFLKHQADKISREINWIQQEL